jgi:acyl carrier protein
MAAKVRGSWLLHRATSGMSLDFFVLFSTGASFLGSPGQSNHAAANAFEDALAHYRRSRGLAGLSINWGAWSGVGAATRGGVAERISAKGLRPIVPELGLRAFEHLLASPEAQAAVLPIDWPEFLAAYPEGRQPLLFAGFEKARPRHATAAAAAPATAPQGPASPGGVERLRALPPQKARAMLLEWVNEDAARVLAIDPSMPIDPARPLNAFGLDSLMAVELRNLLAARAERSLPATLLFNYPTVGDLVDFLASELLVEPTLATAAGAGSVDAEPDAGEELESLSEDELAALLASKLGEA